MFLAVFDTLCGVSVCGITKSGHDDKREPDLYETIEDWRREQVKMLIIQVDEVASGDREPCEVGSDEEIYKVVVYEDGRIIDAFDLVTDYRKAFDRDN